MGYVVKSTLQLIIVTSLLVFLSCNRDRQGHSHEVSEPISLHDSIYVNSGNQLIAITFDTLRSALLTAIGSKGIDGAIEFCNEQAYRLTDMYADGIVLRRTALLYRNSQNRPDSLEHEVLLEMVRMQVPEPKLVRRQNSEIHYFKPIMLQAMCLNCHGAPGKDIQPATLNAISRRYPDDAAVNFKEGDLRGAWHIIFNPVNK